MKLLLLCAFLALGSFGTLASAQDNIGVLQGPYELVAPVLGADPASASRVTGQIFYSLANGVFEGVDPTGAIVTLSGSGSGSSTTITENPQAGSAYTFALADAGKLVSFSNASTPIVATVPAHSATAFPAGTIIDLISNGTGVVTVTPGGGVTINSANGYTSLAAEYAHAKLVQTTTADTWYLYGDLASSSLMSATGGTITSYTSGGHTYHVHTFTSSGTFQVLSGSGTVASLVVAGGGGGGVGYAGGGGAGGLVYTTPGGTYGVGSYSVTVGAGGGGGVTGGTAEGSNGGNSVFDTITTIGGGGGGAYYSSADHGPFTGGSGGGGDLFTGGGSGNAGQGNSGGSGYSVDAGEGGGGGGCGATGGGGSSGHGGNGGNGCSNSITGSAVTYAGGGGGASASNTAGSGGTGGGGNGSQSSAGGPGAANTGAGGGGGGNGTSGGNGGSGVVILVYEYN